MSRATPSSSSTSGSRAAASPCGARPWTRWRTRHALPTASPPGRWRCSTCSMRRCGCLARTSRTWAASPCPPGTEAAEKARCCSTTARRARGRRGDRGGVSGHPAREHSRVDPARQESRASPGTALGGVGDGRRPPGRGRLEGAVGPGRLHRLRNVRADVPRRLLDGRRRDARVPLRRLRGDRGGDAGGEPLRCARRAQHDVAVLAVVRAAGGRRGTGHAGRSHHARLRRSGECAPRRPERRCRQGADVRRSHRRGDGIERPARQAGAARRRSAARQGLVGARQHRLHVRRPLHRRLRRHPALRPGLSGHHPPGHAQGLQHGHLHAAADGAPSRRRARCSARCWCASCPASITPPAR